MLSELRKIAWGYNCFVFPIKNNHFKVYCLDFENLSLCMHHLNLVYDLKFISNYFKSFDNRGFHFIIQFY